MEFLDWVKSISDEQRVEFAGLADSDVMGYLNDRGVILPDELLETITGGAGAEALLKEAIERYLNAL